MAEQQTTGTSLEELKKRLLQVSESVPEKGKKELANKIMKSVAKRDEFPTKKGAWSKYISFERKGKEQPTVYLPEPKDREYVRFCLMDALRFLSYDIVVPEFTYAGCRSDVFAVASGRAVEFEIKMSREDLLKDFDKRMTFGGINPMKHDMLASGKSIMSKFWFVVPEGLITASECPQHCGLITFDMNEPGGWFLKVVKIAPLLHRSFVGASTWATIAKRLDGKCQALLSKFSKTEFAERKRRGLCQLLP